VITWLHFFLCHILPPSPAETQTSCVWAQAGELAWFYPSVHAPQPSALASVPHPVPSFIWWAPFVLFPVSKLGLGPTFCTPSLGPRMAIWLSPSHSFFFFFLRDRVSLCSPGCPGTHFVDQACLELRNPPASASQVLGLKACATTAQLSLPL
jgi:hypothetical protein